MGTHRRAVGTGQEIHSPTETGRKQNLSAETRGREETDTTPLAAGRHLYMCYEPVSNGRRRWRGKQWEKPHGSGGEKGGNTHDIKLLEDTL
jgi:hypothetical protein